MSERKAVIKNADMSEDMQQDAIDCATQVTTQCTSCSSDDLSAVRTARSQSIAYAQRIRAVVLRPTHIKVNSDGF